MKKTWNSNPHRGYYKGFWCDSSWQLAIIIYCLQHKIEIVRNTKIFPYKFGRKIEGYKPDFIIAGKYVQVKGFKDYRSKRKLQQFPYPITVIGSRQIKIYLQYAKSKYGQNFWRLLQN